MQSWSYSLDCGYLFGCRLQSGWIHLLGGYRVSWLQASPKMLLLFVPGCRFLDDFRENDDPSDGSTSWM